MFVSVLPSLGPVLSWFVSFLPLLGSVLSRFVSALSFLVLLLSSFVSVLSLLVSVLSLFVSVLSLFVSALRSFWTDGSGLRLKEQPDTLQTGWAVVEAKVTKHKDRANRNMERQK